MRIEKKSLAKLDRCYAASSVRVEGELRVLLATEGKGSCLQFGEADFRASTVWDGPGGTMSIVEIPDARGAFLAIQNFFPTFQAESATIVRGNPRRDGGWEIKTLFSLPYVHRFDVLKAGELSYFLGATLCGSKKDKEDWSDPGKVWVGQLPASPDAKIELKPILEGLVRNHGYCHVEWEGGPAGLVCADQGIFAVYPPLKSGGEWKTELVLDRPVSDVAVCDIDGDGIPELATIEPFHGKRLRVYKKNGKIFEPVWEYEKNLDFGHAVWGGMLRGVPTFLFGYRKEAAELFYLHCKSVSPLRLAATTIEAGGGPSNVTVVNERERDLIIVANRMIGEAAVFVVTD